MLDFPGVIDAEPIGQLHLVERLLVEALLGAVVPGPRQLMLAEDPELHAALTGSTMRNEPRLEETRLVPKNSTPLPGIARSQGTG